MGAIVWVASYPRSGNTWIRIFLHNLLGHDGASEVDLDQLDAFSTWDIAARWYAPFLTSPPNLVTKDAVAAFRPAAQQRIADSVDGLIFVKTHAALVRERGTPTIDMTRTAGAVYLVRNPLDVCVSYAAHMGLGIEEAAEILITPRFETSNGPHSVYEFYGSWSQNVESWTRRPHHAVLTLRFEDLVDDPIGQFSRLARHLRIDAQEDEVRAAVEKSSFERLSSIEAAKGFRERPEYSSRFFRSGKIGSWRNVLPDALVEKISERHGDTMRRFGYLT
jgi:hypothetical protein